jgi:RND family efflux transporter MFP subunit
LNKGMSMKRVLTLLTFCAASFAGVQTYEVGSIGVAAKKEFSASIYSKSEISVSSRMPGFVKRVSVEEGDRVRAGQALFEIDAAGSKAELADAKRDFERYKALLESGVVSEREFEKVKLVYELKKEQFSYSVITSPIDGVVTKKFVNAGSMAMPSQPVLSISGKSDLRVQTIIDEKDAVGIKIGDTFATIVPTLSKTLRAKVVSITPNPSLLHSFLLKGELESAKELNAGMYAKIRFDAKGASGASILASTITKRGGIVGVFALEGANAKFYPIKIISQNSDAVEVDGVKKGQKLILYPKATIADGQKAE